MGSPKGFSVDLVPIFNLSHFRDSSPISMQLFILGSLSLVSAISISFSDCFSLPIRHNIVDLLIISMGKSLHTFIIVHTRAIPAANP